jgi:hypothetical protein
MLITSRPTRKERKSPQPRKPYITILHINMHKSIAALALLGAVSAQTTAIELFLVAFDQQALVGSVITSV